MDVSFKVVAAHSGETPFQRALQQYLEGLDEKAMAKDFFVNCYDQIRDNPTAVDPNDADQINRILQGRVEKDMKKSSTTGKVMQTLAELQQKYDEFVNTLVAFDPTPISGAVWTCVGVLAKTVDSYFKVPDKIAGALISLGDDLKSIKTYNRLFRSSPALEDVFCQSYLDIFRFWNRVFQELLRKKPMRMLASLAGADKFDSIISDMQKNAGRVKQMVKLAEKTRAFEEKQEEKVRLFLGRSIPAVAPTSTLDHHVPDSQQAILEKQCCEWIFEQSAYQSWLAEDATLCALWVHGPPGSGKSTLCRKVAQSVDTNNSSAVIASHYFRFDQNHTTFDVLKSLTVQLWDQWVLRHPSPALLDKLAVMAVEGMSGHEPLSQLVMILRELTNALPAVYFFIDGVDEEVAKGVEGQVARDSLKNALGILDEMDTLIKSVADCNSTVRLWISSQDIPWAQRKFKAYVPFNIKDAVKAGIYHYLSQTIGDLTVIPPKRQESILQELVTRAESNFLWARLMVVELRKAKTEEDMDEALEAGRAKDLDEYYSNFFDKRLIEKKDVILSRDVFSLVTFARSPLRVGEVHEAVSVLRSSGSRPKDPRKHTVFMSSLLESFSPFIEVQEEQGIEAADNSQSGAPVTGVDDSISRKTCRLFHSTLFDFLQRHMSLFYEDEKKESQGNSDNPKFRVSQSRIAESCLLYLAQAKYSQPLRRQGDVWVDKDDNSVSEHHFLLYSAKNWDKHLDLVAPDGSDYPSSQVVENALPLVEAHFRPHVRDFLTSPNYQTCLQVQSLWAVGTFRPFHVGDSKIVHIRRSLPRWSNFHKDYHRFWWDWGHFLGWVNFMDVREVFKPYTGEIDRCWWGSLGSDNFLSTLPSRYPSFRFQSETLRRPQEGKHDLDMQTANATSDSVKILWRISGAHNTLTFVLEVWKYGRDKLPFLKKSQTLSVDEAACRASFFATRAPDGSKQFSFSGEGGRAPLASFSDDGQCLRIGTQLYTIDSAGECLVFAGIAPQKEDYIEEITGNSYVIVITNRGSVPIIVDPSLTQHSGNPALKLGGRQEIFDDTGELTEIFDEVEGSDPGDVFDDGGWESWSECSSAQFDLGRKAKSDSNHTSSDSGSEQDEQDESDTESSESEDTNEPEVTPDGDQPRSMPGQANFGTEDKEDDLDSNDEEYDSPLLAFSQIHQEPAYNVYSDVDDVDDESTDEESKRESDSKPTKAARKEPFVGEDQTGRGSGEPENIGGSDKSKIWIVQRQQASLRIFTPTGRIFSFIASLSTQLSNSPPVLHPTQPLVVWPLSEWSVLFADYEDNTYFIRELGTSEERTSRMPNDTNFLVKCHFTDDGRYLHIASFQGRSIDSPFFLCGPEPTFVSLVLYTYKLCAQKPTRAPPALIHSHEMHLDLFDKSRLNPRFPCTLTWTDNHLYVVRSCPALHIYKLPLLREEAGDGFLGDTKLEAQYPKGSIPIPASAADREVFFFPSEDDLFARVVVGAPIIRLVGYTLPGDVPAPLGCNLDIAKDVGGWVTRTDPAWSKRYCTFST